MLAPTSDPGTGIGSGARSAEFHDWSAVDGTIDRIADVVGLLRCQRLIDGSQHDPQQRVKAQKVCTNSGLFAKTCAF